MISRPFTCVYLVLLEKVDKNPPFKPLDSGTNLGECFSWIMDVYLGPVSQTACEVPWNRQFSNHMAHQHVHGFPSTHAATPRFSIARCHRSSVSYFQTRPRKSPRCPVRGLNDEGVESSSKPRVADEIASMRTLPAPRRSGCLCFAFFLGGGVFFRFTP